jgi:hypothetical protein
MVVILDTNIIQRDFLLNSGRFVILLDYLTRSKSKIILPEIVYKEIVANYERSLNGWLTQLDKVRKDSGRLLFNTRLPDIRVSVPEEVERYRQYLLKKLRVAENEVFDYKPSYLDNVVCRAVERRKPCTEQGEELRDAILWESVKDIAHERPKDRVALITGNTRQFASEGTLHPQLAIELQEAGLHIDYFTSLDDFLKQYADKIEFITDSWLAGSIDFNEGVNQGVKSAHGSLGSLRSHSMLG